MQVRRLAHAEELVFEGDSGEAYLSLLQSGRSILTNASEPCHHGRQSSDDFKQSAVPHCWAFEACDPQCVPHRGARAGNHGLSEVHLQRSNH
jgi:hypothetical protein